MATILAADVGGTSSRFALFAESAGLEPVRRAWLPTGEASSFADLLARLADEGFVAADHGGVDAVVLAVPGPVVGERYCDPPNIAWDIDLERDLPHMPEALFPASARVRLINDFVAQAFATRTPVMERALTIQSGRADPCRAIAVIGAGTGLGHCALLPTQQGAYVPLPSEGGHVAFPFTGVTERDCERFFLERLGVGYCSQEHVVSGAGLALVHEWLSGERLRPAEVSERLGDHPQTVRWFARFYGRAARQYAMQVLATGGLFITGGVAAKNHALVMDPAFVREFGYCPGYEELLGEIPVLLNVDEESGLHGAALFGRQQMRRRDKECP